eukprot:2652505-Pyramimonas_sp.AAC.1
MAYRMLVPPRIRQRSNWDYLGAAGFSKCSFVRTRVRIPPGETRPTVPRADQPTDPREGAPFHQPPPMGSTRGLTKERPINLTGEVARMEQ